MASTTRKVLKAAKAKWHIDVFRDLCKAHGLERRKSADDCINELASHFGDDIHDLVESRKSSGAADRNLWNDVLEELTGVRRKSLDEIAVGFDDFFNKSGTEDDDDSDEDGRIAALRAEIEPSLQGQSGARFNVADLVNAVEVGEAYNRLSTKAAQALGEIIEQAGYEQEPDLRTIIRSPGVEGEVFIRPRVRHATADTRGSRDSTTSTHASAPFHSDNGGPRPRSNYDATPTYASRPSDVNPSMPAFAPASLGTGGFAVGARSSRFEVITRGVPPEGLHEYQKAALQALDDKLLLAGNGGLLCLPTGGGKTKVAVWWLLSRFVDLKKRVLWLACADELLDQAAKAFRHHGGLLQRRDSFSLGVLKATGNSEGAMGADVVVASLQTVSRRELVASEFNDSGKIDVIVFDEAHHAPAKTYLQSLERLRYRDGVLLGLTATPTRASAEDRQVLHQIFNRRIVHQTTYVELLHQRFLARPLHKLVNLDGKIEITPQWAEEIERDNELPSDLLAKLADDSARTTQITKHLKQWQSAYKPMLVFAVNLSHADSLTKELIVAGVEARYLDGETPRAERHKMIAQLNANEIAAVVNVGVLTEGADLPMLKAVIIARPTMSEGLYTQMVGRGSRGPDVGGKEEFHVVDFVDNFSRFGDRLAHRYVLESGMFVQPQPIEDGGGQVSALRTARGEEIPRGVQRAVEALMREGRAHLTAPTQIHEFQLSGWLRWQNNAAGESESDYLPFFASDAAAVEAALDILRLKVTAQMGTAAAHETAKEVYSARLFGSAVPPWRWLLVAEAFASGRGVVLERYEARQPPDLQAIARDLRALSGPAVLRRVRETYEANPHWRLLFSTIDDFNRAVEKVST